MKHLFLLKQYFFYWLKAKTAHGIHSPFVFDFIQTVLQDKREFYAFDDIEKVRKQLLADNTILTVEDFGAGSLHGVTSQRKVKDIAKNAGRNKKYGELLFRITEKYQCKNILELGTSLGLGTSYLASACRIGKVVTIEGCKEISSYAAKTFSALSLSNIEQVTGNLDVVLEDVLKKNPAFDLVFIDGNHRKEATLQYFHFLLEYCDEYSILIFDDIHWSKGMHEAWNEIRSHEDVTLSIDLFFFGIVFFKKEFMKKQDFVLKY